MKSLPNFFLALWNKADKKTPPQGVVVSRTRSDEVVLKGDLICKILENVAYFFITRLCPYYSYLT